MAETQPGCSSQALRLPTSWSWSSASPDGWPWRGAGPRASFGVVYTDVVIRRPLYRNERHAATRLG